MADRNGDETEPDDEDSIPLVPRDIVELARALRFISDCDPQQHARMRGHGETRPRRGRTCSPRLVKLTSLELNRRRTDPDHDWRSALWSAAEEAGMRDDRVRAPLAVLLISGCRPCELVSGVTITVDTADPSKGLDLWIPAPRSFGMARTLNITPASVEARWLMRWVLSKGERGAASAGGADLEGTRLALPVRLAGSSDPAAAMARFRADLARLGQAAFPELATDITPALLRHALAAEFRKGCELPVVLGHGSGPATTRYAAGPRTCVWRRLQITGAAVAGNGDAA